MRARHTIGLAVALLLAAPLPAQAVEIDPLRPPTVTDEQLRASTFDLTGGAFDLTGEGEDIEKSTKEGSATIVTLNSDILFAFGKAEISAAAKAKIAELVTPVPQGATVQVGGHTDSVGSDASNLTLSQKRAGAVRAAILAARSDLKVAAKGYGETQPVAANSSGGKDDPSGRAKNRRVEIRYDG